MKISKLLQENYADSYSKNQGSIKEESIKRNERIKTIETRNRELEKFTLTNSERMVNQLNDRKNKLSSKLNFQNLEQQPQITSRKKGANF